LSKISDAKTRPMRDLKLSVIERIASIPDIKDIALITNGILLPQMAQDLADAGLGRVTVSLDSLDETVFPMITGGRGTVARVLEGIGAAEEAGFTGLKINTVEQRIRSTWSKRQDQYSKNRHGQDKEEHKIEMYQLGG
jgi:wyosine [tRNA(Phe)-imidazoG37] synthetase (radical SAM superfamily)